MHFFHLIHSEIMASELKRRAGRKKRVTAASEAFIAYPAIKTTNMKIAARRY